MAQSTYEQLRSQVDALNSLVNLQDNKAIRTDEQVAGTTYIGRAHPGADPADGVWQISRAVVTTSLPITTTITWADGNTNSDNIWNSRTGLSYS